MIIACPNCGERVVVNGLSRKKLNIPRLKGGDQ